mmetsp:Transcript_4350/g.9953  ORF Transcript_4350/g.9953 Transcript_4350/m.9953 type:complete len:226 (+) Transcript_4350:540-1217(+)
MCRISIRPTAVGTDAPQPTLRDFPSLHCCSLPTRSRTVLSTTPSDSSCPTTECALVPTCIQRATMAAPRPLMRTRSSTAADFASRPSTTSAATSRAHRWSSEHSRSMACCCLTGGILLSLLSMMTTRATRAPSTLLLASAHETSMACCQWTLRCWMAHLKGLSTAGQLVSAMTSHSTCRPRAYQTMARGMMGQRPHPHPMEMTAAPNRRKRTVVVSRRVWVALGG